MIFENLKSEKLFTSPKLLVHFPYSHVLLSVYTKYKISLSQIKLVIHILNFKLAYIALFVLTYNNKTSKFYFCNLDDLT